MELQPVFPDLIFERLLGLYPLPNSNWLAVEQAGIISLITPSGSGVSVFLDIEERVQSSELETGLVGVALSEDFSESGVFYVYYTAPDPFRSVLARFYSNGYFADPGSETILMEIPQPSLIHNAGQIVFGPDGYLYVAVGDGGGFSDPFGHGQTLNSLLGSVLRIDVGEMSGYRVPPDNPFVGRPGVREEIWAYGLRNPWRFSFDSFTGEMWLADVGERTHEEVNTIVKGGNYGWCIMEGSACFRDVDCPDAGLQPPIFEYTHNDGGCAITGGFVYRGSEITDLRGAYVYGDFCSGRIWALRLEAGKVAENVQIGQADFRISSFAQGNDGELYVLEHASDGGGIYKLVPER